MLPVIPTIPSVMAQTVARCPENIAIVEDGMSLTYAELERRALHVTRALMAQGIEAGDRVALWAPNSAAWIIAALGIHLAGAALVPANTRMKGAEIGYMLSKSRASLIFVAGDFLGTYYPDLLDGHAPESLRKIVVLDGFEAREAASSWEAFLAGGDVVPEAAARERSEAVTPTMLSDIMFTSGTTGNPKGVMTTHGQNLRSIHDWAVEMGLHEGDRYLMVNPFFHAFGYKVGWLVSVYIGLTMFPQQIFEADCVLERIERERISVLPGPPTVFYSLLASPRLEKTDLSSLRATITGASTIAPSLIARMREALGFDIVLTGYGLTECCGTATLSSPGDDAQTVATTSGRAVKDVEIRIVDAMGQTLPAGEPGEVLIRGYNVMQGYYDDDVATREAIDDEGWLHTGDVGFLDERGYLKLTDRIKDLFIVGGFNCYPAEIEKYICEHPAVAQAAVVGVPDERMGEVGRAYIILRHGESLDGETLQAWCRANMANYKVPRYFDFVTSYPTNASGKVLKRDLRKLALAAVDLACVALPENATARPVESRRVAT